MWGRLWGWLRARGGGGRVVELVDGTRVTVTGVVGLCLIAHTEQDGAKTRRLVMERDAANSATFRRLWNEFADDASLTWGSDGSRARL